MPVAAVTVVVCVLCASSGIPCPGAGAGGLGGWAGMGTLRGVCIGDSIAVGAGGGGGGWLSLSSRVIYLELWVCCVGCVWLTGMYWEALGIFRDDKSAVQYIG